MFRLALVTVLISCGGSPAPQRPADPAPAPPPPPAAPAPAPSDAAVAQVSPDAAPPAAPPVLSTDLAIVYADKLGLVRAGSPIDAEPQLVALPSRVHRPPVWSGSGELFLALDHGEVARVDAGGVHVLALPKAARRPWMERRDQLYRAKDGSVWVSHCDKPGKQPDECAKTTFVRVDATRLALAATGPAPIAATQWPKVEPPSGYSLRSDFDGMAHIVCERAPPGSPYKMPAGEVRLPGAIGGMMWVTRSPAVLGVRVVQLGFVVIPDPPGSRGGTTNAEAYVVGESDTLIPDCDFRQGGRSRIVAAPDGLYAFRDADTWKLARDGVVLHELSGALDVAFAP